MNTPDKLNVRWNAFNSLGDNPEAVSWDDYCEIQHIIQVWADGGLLMWELERTGRLEAALDRQRTQ